mgnify:CR=1 FL=1
MKETKDKTGLNEKVLSEKGQENLRELLHLCDLIILKESMKIKEDNENGL